MMKNKIFIVTLFLSSMVLNAQSYGIAINDRLLLQLTENQGVRILSNESFRKSYEKQRKLYEDANQKMTQVVAIHEYIYQNLANINAAIRNGKQLVYFYQYSEKIVTHSQEMLKLTAQHPEYAILLTKYYNQIIQESILLKQEVTSDIMNESKDFLMNTYDRDILIEKMLARARAIDGWILYINIMLKTGKNRPYIEQIPILQDYVNLDKILVQDIITKYTNIF
ncbi:hypothetical protein [Chryseobacterium taklimakanense]|uniref:Uncharacterized protein n=1 Tax=Chryseobacterium taklimakanense TaxID=536441 RepID=A0A3G8WXX0_9FLAO|nr:hypothetical protein [Chryseobacterium taklimakanense]AZI20616.1 hypothetical protein EIH08_07705 [Chryseobacterium taklimakanense]